MTGPFRPIVLVVALAAVSACAGAPPNSPALQVREVKTPVAMPCTPDLGAAPAYPDTDAALKAAPDLFSRVRLMVSGRLLRIARERELNAALAACAAQARR